MSVPVNKRILASADVLQLMRNMMILPVVRSNFESDQIVFEKSSRYDWRSPYAAVAERAIKRIDADVANVACTLHNAGYTIGEEERERDRITRIVDCRGERQSFTLRYGTFEGELELLMDYYLGNLEYAPARDDDR